MAKYVWIFRSTNLCHMNTLTSTPFPGPVHHFPQQKSDIYGSIEIERSQRDDTYQQIIERKKEYVSWVAPVNILQGLDYMKIEIAVPGITKDNCRIGCSGVFLWVKLNKNIKEKSETFYCTFILPENLITSQLTASYEINDKIEIIIPKEKRTDISKRLDHD